MEGTSVGTATQTPGAPSASPAPSSSSQPSQRAQGQTPTASGMQAQANPNAQTRSTGENLANQTQSTPEQNPAPRKLSDADMDALVTVKINGKTEELPLKEVIKLQQLEKASHEKMRQAAEIQKKFQEMMQMDLDRLAQMRGMDPDEWAEQRLAQKYELMQMSPEQRRLHELETKEAQRAQQEAQVKQHLIEQIKEYQAELPPGLENATPEQLHAFAEHSKQLYEIAQRDLERELVDAWKESGLPEDKFFGTLMAHAMKSHLQQTGEALQAAQAAAKVKQEFGGHVRRILGRMDASAIQEFLGKELTTKLREYDVQRVTGQPPASNVNQSSRPDVSSASQEKKYLNQTEWRQAMGLT